MCHACYNEVEGDAWISKACWESLNPDTSYDDLPEGP